MPEKLVKAVKKLKKLWPRKRRKKQPPVIWINAPPQLEYYHLSPHDFHYACSSSKVEPSAPPLPSWLDIDIDLDLSEPEAVPATETSSSNHLTSSSYQQYMVTEPVFVVPAMQPKEKRRPRELRPGRGGFFGCMVSFVMNALGCFCPCLQIREVP